MPDYIQRGREQRQKEAALLKVALVLFQRPMTDSADALEGHVTHNLSDNKRWQPPLRVQLRVKRRVAEMFIDGLPLPVIGGRFSLELEQVREILRITKESFCYNHGLVAVGTVAVMDGTMALCRTCWKTATRKPFPAPLRKESMTRYSKYTYEVRIEATDKVLSPHVVFDPMRPPFRDDAGIRAELVVGKPLPMKTTVTTKKLAKMKHNMTGKCVACRHREVFHGPLIDGRRLGCMWTFCECVEYKGFDDGKS